MPWQWPPDHPFFRLAIRYAAFVLLDKARGAVAFSSILIRIIFMDGNPLLFGKVAIPLIARPLPVVEFLTTVTVPSPLIPFLRLFRFVFIALVPACPRWLLRQHRACHKDSCQQENKYEAHSQRKIFHYYLPLIYKNLPVCIAYTAIFMPGTLVSTG